MAHKFITHAKPLCLAVLKWVLKKRNDLKLIISSATLDSEKFSAYFFDAAVYHISGRMFPVEIIYEPCYPYSYEDRTLQVVSQINKMDKGDILVFLTGLIIMYKYFLSIWIKNSNYVFCIQYENVQLLKKFINYFLYKEALF